MPEDEEHRERFLLAIEEKIARHGWTAIGVLPAEEDEGLPFAYTVGLVTSLRSPELIVMGMSQQGIAVIVTAVDLMKEGREPFKPDEETRELLVGDLRCRFVSVAPEVARDYLTIAFQRYPTPPPVLQIQWPDEQDRLPGDPGMNVEMEARQLL